MEDKVLKRFDYYYGVESDSFNFIQVPRFLFTNPDFRNLKSDSKILYSLMLDRMSLSRKNKWFDEENRVFIIYTLDDMMESIGCGHTKCVDLLKELSMYGLIERKKRGLGKPDIIYVKDFLHALDDESRVDGKQDFRKTELRTSEGTKDFRKTEAQTSEKRNSGLPEDESPDFWETETSNTDKNYSDLNQTDRSQVLKPLQNQKNKLSDDDETRANVNPIEELVKANIGYERLTTDHPANIKLFDYIVRVMCDMLTELGPRVLIAKNHYEDVSLVRKKIGSLTYEDIIALFDQLPDISEQNISDPNSFMRTCLFNAKDRTDAVCYTTQRKNKKSGSREYDFNALMKCINT